MYNKCKVCNDVRTCKLRKQGMRDLCRVLPPAVQAPKQELVREGVPLLRYEGQAATVGRAEPFNDWGQLVERRKGTLGRQKTLALKLESVKSKYKLFVKSSAKSALLDDSQLVPDSALSFDPEAHESRMGGWIPETEPEPPSCKAHEV